MSKETQIKNRELLKYIRKGLSIQEDFILCGEGYQSLFDKTNKILALDKSKFSEEYMHNIFTDAKRINDKIKVWKEKIDTKISNGHKKYITIYFYKWLGMDYLYSYDNLYHKKFSYKNYSISGAEISHAINDFIKYVKQVKKATDNAREILVNDNVALIHHQAHKVAGNRYDIIEDLVSVASCQFIQCMDHTFDLNKGIEFSTYVSYCMFHKCKEAKIKYDEIIKIPTARIKYKTLSAKGELDISAKDINDDKKRAKESLIRSTISNSSMYWSLDNDKNEENNNINDSLLSDGNSMEILTNDMMINDTVQRIINKILENEKNTTKIKALEYSGALDFNNELGNQKLKTVAEQLYLNRYTETLVTIERARQLILEGKKLIRKQIMKDHDFVETLGLSKEISA